VVVGIAYDEDIDNARKVLEKVLKDNKYTIQTPGEGIFVAELADSSVNLILR
jgi:small conductance mechanosensitive channel